MTLNSFSYQLPKLLLIFFENFNFRLFLIEIVPIFYQLILKFWLETVAKVVVWIGMVVRPEIPILKLYYTVPIYVA